ncbi:DUF2752 domain-containing protein [Actinomadura gamaensis]|uniref:DUF2752 domain-containing protein n=1 Tax=Actinomadura gamaensis TaxID=1763541 RepID=A0ABV9U0E9_9ACTN
MGGTTGPTVTGAPHGALGGMVDRSLVAARRGPLGVALRVAAMATAAVAAAWVHRVHDPGVLCPLRTLTGIPCPLCGGTTAFIELGAGRPGHAVLANPVALTGAVALALAPLGLGARWWELAPETRRRVLGAALVASELWQLVRLGVLRV